MADAAEGGDYLVRDQQDIVLFEDWLDGRPVTFRRRNDAAGAHYRFADERGNRVRPFGQYQLIQFFSTVVRKFLLTHAFLCAVIVMRRNRMFHRVYGQVEMSLEHGQTGQAAGHDAGTVITAQARDDLVSLRASKHVIVVPGQLDLGFIGVGTGHAVIDLAHAARGHFDNPPGQLDNDLAGMAHVGVVVSQLFCLGMDRVGDLHSAVTDIDTIQPSKGIQ